MKNIYLATGELVLVDDADFELVSLHHWCRLVTPSGLTYAVTNILKPDGRKTTARMHRLITGAPVGQQIDHKDGNGLNNSRANLRYATNLENGRAFHRKRPNLTSRFRGVSWHHQNRRWRATVSTSQPCGRRRQVSAGCYGTEEEAARAYNKKAQELGFFTEALNQV